MMDPIALSDKDLGEVYSLFSEFHEEYTPFFQVRTKNVAKAAQCYLQGQLFTRQQMNMVQFCREVPESEYSAMQHFIPKQGKMSVGVSRQYCGCLGKVDNCQVVVYLAYANSHHTSLIDYRLYLPESWIEDKERRMKCRVPTDIEFQTCLPSACLYLPAYRQDRSVDRCPVLPTTCLTCLTACLPQAGRQAAVRGRRQAGTGRRKQNWGLI